MSDDESGTRVPKRLVIGVDLASGPDRTGYVAVMTEPTPRPALKRLMAFTADTIKNDTRFSFSRWCRSGWIGVENCICKRCLGSRGVTWELGQEAREKEAERLAKLLDLAYKAGQEMGKLMGSARLADTPTEDEG